MNAKDFLNDLGLLKSSDRKKESADLTEESDFKEGQIIEIVLLN